MLDNETAIKYINSFECVYENLHLYKLLYVVKKIIFNKWEKITLFGTYFFCEFLLIVCKYIDIYLFSQLLENEVSNINNTIAIGYLANHFFKSLISENNKFLIKYISTKDLFEHETLIQETVNKLNIATVNKFDKWKIIQYPLTYIPNFLNCFTNFSNLFFLFFEFIFVIAYLISNSYFKETSIVVAGFILLLFFNLYKFLILHEPLNNFNENYGGLFDLKDEQYSNNEYLKSANILMKDMNHERFVKKYNEVFKSSNIVYSKKVTFSFGLNGFQLCVFSSIFILGLFQTNINIYLFLYALYLLLEPIDLYLSTFISNLTEISNICSLYDFFHLENANESPVDKITQHYPQGTQESYNSFSSRNLIMGKGKDLGFPEGRGGCQGEPWVPPKITKDSKEFVDIETSITNPTSELTAIESIEFIKLDKTINKRPILNNISFHLKKGMKIGIVGESGSGKTTITRLILKMIHPTSGDIYFNGINSKQLSFETIRDNIIYIGQEPKLFDLSLKQNLLMEMNTPTETVTDEQLYEMLKRVSLNIDPERLHEDIGMFGNKFSGGQKQKINILRGLLKNASVIILDEPTSALDVNSEHQVMEYIYELCKDKIMIIIAHKLNTIKNVDYILVMKEGEIIEEGSHESLMEKNEIYKGMVDKFYEKR
jgi:ABC-type multidrug transport system fused ATPase/permease subunit